MVPPIALSIVIPTLDAEDGLAATLAALEDARATTLDFEVIIVDGGSRDGTLAVARRAGLRVVAATGGRGGQLATGARAAQGAWLLFLHADTVPRPGWPAAVTAFMAKPENQRRAAAFRFVLDDEARAARRLEAIVAWRCRRLALPYGDQGLLIGRAFYDALGGYRPLPIMEDVDLVRRVGRRRLHILDQPAATSAERYRRGGYLARSARNLSCLGLYWVGIPTRWIVRLYG